MENKVRRLQEENASLKRQLQSLRDTATVGEASITMLLASEAKYRDLFENAIDPIFILDDSFRYVDVNRRASKVFGFTRDEFLSMRIFDVIPDDQFSRSEDALRDLRLNGTYEHFEGKMQTKDGQWLDIEVSSSAIFDADGNVIGSRDIVRDISGRKRIEKALRQSLSEKEMILCEMNHRVKNNLQVITSLLSLQSMKTGDPEAAAVLRDSENRLRSMSLIHEKLYRSDDFIHIHFSEYLKLLIQELFNSYNVSDDINLEIDIPEAALDVEAVIPCGIIVNELVSNALKYAFPNGSGTIHVGFHRQEDGICHLSVRDDGIGISEETTPQNANLESFGLRLVKTSAEKLKADIFIDNNHGTAYLISFREKTPENFPSIHRDAFS